LIPYLMFLGRRGTAERFIDVAINTAKTDKNLYAYTWFKIYSAILRGDRGYLERVKGRFEKRRFIYHTVLCKYALGEDVEDLKEKFWHHHTVKFVDALKFPYKQKMGGFRPPPFERTYIRVIGASPTSSREPYTGCKSQGSR